MSSRFIEWLDRISSHQIDLGEYLVEVFNVYGTANQRDWKQALVMRTWEGDHQTVYGTLAKAHTYILLAKPQINQRTKDTHRIVGQLLEEYDELRTQCSTDILWCKCGRRVREAGEQS